MKKKARIAHLGGGYWGKNIIRNLSELSVLQAICDSDTAALEKYRTEYKGVTLAARTADVFKDKTIAAVTIATPSATHFALVKEALIAGKDVFVEKPLALNPAEGEELAELSERLNRILMVGHIMRYHPAIQKMKELVDAGDIGKVRHFYSNRLNLGKVRTEENILWSFAPHDISIMNYLMGSPPSDVKASGQVILQPDIHDVTLTIMKWQDNVMGHIYVSWLHPFKEHRFVVVGDKAMLVFDDTKDSDKLVLYDRGIDFIKGAPVKRDKDARVIEYVDEEPLRAELLHFLDCCESRGTPLTDGREGVEVLRVLAAAQKGIESRTQRPDPGKTKAEFTVHPTAVVDRGAQIGKGTRIWHFSHISATARLGELCSLGQNVYIANNVVIGNNVKIQNNVSVYEGVILEDDCFCGPSMVFTNVRNPRSAFPRNTADDYFTTHVKRGATLGANCTIVCGTSIGEHAFVAAGAVVNRDVKPHAMMVGVPARQIGWACACGMKLLESGSQLHCPDCGRRYQIENGEIRETEPAS